MMYECLNKGLECCGESVWIMCEALNGVSGFVFGFRFLSSGWSCLNLSVDVSMNDVWISEWSVRICFWISFWVSCLSFCGCVYEWCMNVWTNCQNVVENLSEKCMNLWMKCQDLFLDFVLGVLCNLSVDVCTNDVWMSERIVRMLWRICLIMYESLNGVSGFVFGFCFRCLV